MKTLGLLMYILLTCALGMFGLTLLGSPSLLLIALLVVGFAVLIELSHSLEA